MTYRELDDLFELHRINIQEEYHYQEAQRDVHIRMNYYVSGCIRYLIAPFPMVKEGNVFKGGNEE